MPSPRSGILTLAAASATQIYKQTAMPINIWTSSSANACARPRTARLVPFSTKASASVSASPRSAQTISSGTVINAPADAPLCNALKTSTGIRTIADANAPSSIIACPTLIIIIISIRKNVVASAHHQLLLAVTMRSMTPKNASVFASPSNAMKVWPGALSTAVASARQASAL
jgi:hypothetical protein